MSRRSVVDRSHHYAAVAQLEPDEQHANHELPGSGAGRDDAEDDGLNDGAADDYRLAAVLVGPDAPERDERQSRKEEERTEPTDEVGDIGTCDTDIGQPVRQEGVDLSHSEAFDERGYPVEDQQAAPIWHGRETHQLSLAGARLHGRAARFRAAEAPRNACLAWRWLHGSLESPAGGIVRTSDDDRSEDRTGGALVDDRIWKNLSIVLGIVCAVLLGIAGALMVVHKDGSSGPTSSPDSSAISEGTQAPTDGSGGPVSQPPGSSSPGPSGTLAPTPKLGPSSPATITFSGLALDAANDKSGTVRTFTFIS